MSVELLETTLRDGGYEVSFQFTPEDTATIAGLLDQAGVRYIELGHGSGAGAHLYPEAVRVTRAAAIDEAHVAAARAVVKQAKLGVLFIADADFAPISHIDTLGRLGLSYIRLGVFPAKFGPSIYPYIERAKACGFEVSINLMQTYVLSASEVAAGCKKASDLGVDWFYVVDSAGTMLPTEVEKYVRAIRETSGVRVGLHAHNNSGLAVANCLAAISAGATLVDATLAGIGRATGNPPTEQLILLLQALGHEKGIDPEILVRLGVQARRLLAEKGNDPMHFVSGVSRLHSMDAKTVLQAAKTRGQSPVHFMVRAGFEAQRRGLLGQASLPDSLFDTFAEDIRPDRPPTASESLVSHLAKLFEARAEISNREATELFTASAKMRQEASVLFLYKASADSRRELWQDGATAVLSLPIAVGEEPPLVEAHHRPDVLVADAALGRIKLEPNMFQLEVSFEAIVEDAIRETVRAASSIRGGRVRVTGQGPLAHALASLASGGEGRSSIVVSIGADLGSIGSALASGDLVILAASGEEARRTADALRARGIEVVCPLVGPSIAARVLVQRHLRSRLQASLRPEHENGVGITDGFAAPGLSDVVVDQSEAPRWPIDLGAADPGAAAKALAVVRLRAILSGKGRF